ncbi:F-box/kelch-repeat protein [Camellia lanceoleosa]|uniref:F-box/kelch-repeat protein n=1 Tax=Camellia lanceoleosa TaxID=1840588 RepID=A0ACC0GX53_9ERIC|nr:F-box/kelch-repeat protein [Camellia lanceoleosa]
MVLSHHSPSFISTHLNRNKQHDPPLLLLRYCSERPRKEHFSIHHDNPTLDDYAELDFPFHSVNWYFRIVGSCNGVVCLSDDHMCYVHTIILWNPSIRKSFNLPRPSVVFQTHGPFMHSIGFGFDSINHECKVVRVTYVGDGDGFDIVPPEVELYSLSRGCWQSISYCGLQSIIPEGSPQVYINGAVHWIAYDRKTNGSIHRSLIVSFNMCDELFWEIFLPDSLAAQCGIDIEINVFGESLCVMHDVFLSGSNQTYDMVLGRTKAQGQGQYKEAGKGGSGKMIEVEALWIVGSCNGVVCLSDDHICYVHTIILWNPSIRKSFNLPRPSVVFQTHGPFVHSIGFGFDSINHECKVVRVTYVEDGDGFDIVPPEVELYSVSRGCWQSISYCGLQSIIPEGSPQVYINGAVHWIAYDRKTNGSFHCSLIVTFNMCDELFRQVFLPDSLAAQCWTNLKINVFGESLCVMHHVWSSANKGYDIWVMEKCGVVESWTKLFAIIDYQESLGPVIGFRKNSEVLLVSSGNLVSYDPETKEKKNHGIHGLWLRGKLKLKTRKPGKAGMGKMLEVEALRK